MNPRMPPQGPNLPLPSNINHNHLNMNHLNVNNNPNYYHNNNNNNNNNNHNNMSQISSLVPPHHRLHNQLNHLNPNYYQNPNTLMIGPQAGVGMGMGMVTAPGPPVGQGQGQGGGLGVGPSGPGPGLGLGLHGPGGPLLSGVGPTAGAGSNGPPPLPPNQNQMHLSVNPNSNPNPNLNPNPSHQAPAPAPAPGSGNVTHYSSMNMNLHHNNNALSHNGASVGVGPRLSINPYGPNVYNNPNHNYNTIQLQSMSKSLSVSPSSSPTSLSSSSIPSRTFSNVNGNSYPNPYPSSGPNSSPTPSQSLYPSNSLSPSNSATSNSLSVSVSIPSTSGPSPSPSPSPSASVSASASASDPQAQVVPQDPSGSLNFTSSSTSTSTSTSNSTSSSNSNSSTSTSSLSSVSPSLVDPNLANSSFHPYNPYHQNNSQIPEQVHAANSNNNNGNTNYGQVKQPVSPEGRASSVASERKNVNINDSAREPASSAITTRSTLESEAHLVGTGVGSNDGDNNPKLESNLEKTQIGNSTDRSSLIAPKEKEIVHTEPDLSPRDSTHLQGSTKFSNDVDKSDDNTTSSNGMNIDKVNSFTPSQVNSSTLNGIPNSSFVNPISDLSRFNYANPANNTNFIPNHEYNSYYSHYGGIPYNGPPTPSSANMNGVPASVTPNLVNNSFPRGAESYPMNLLSNPLSSQNNSSMVNQNTHTAPTGVLLPIQATTNHNVNNPNPSSRPGSSSGHYAPYSAVPPIYNSGPISNHSAALYSSHGPQPSGYNSYGPIRPGPLPYDYSNMPSSGPADGNYGSSRYNGMDPRYSSSPNNGGYYRYDTPTSIPSNTSPYTQPIYDQSPGSVNNNSFDPRYNRSLSSQGFHTSSNGTNMGPPYPMAMRPASQASHHQFMRPPMFVQNGQSYSNNPYGPEYPSIRSNEVPHQSFTHKKKISTTSLKNNQTHHDYRDDNENDFDNDLDQDEPQSQSRSSSHHSTRHRRVDHSSDEDYTPNNEHHKISSVRAVHTQNNHSVPRSASAASYRPGQSKIKSLRLSNDEPVSPHSNSSSPRDLSLPVRPNSSASILSKSGRPEKDSAKSPSLKHKKSRSNTSSRLSNSVRPFKSSIHCWALNPITGERTSRLESTYFDGNEIDVFVASIDEKQRVLYKASALAKKLNCPTNKLGMYLGRRRAFDDGIYQAISFRSKPSSDAGLKSGNYFITEEVCRAFELHFHECMMKKDENAAIVLQKLIRTDSPLPHSSSSTTPSTSTIITKKEKETKGEPDSASVKLEKDFALPNHKPKSTRKEIQERQTEEQAEEEEEVDYDNDEVEDEGEGDESDGAGDSFTAPKHFKGRDFDDPEPENFEPKKNEDELSKPKKRKIENPEEIDI